MFYLRSEVNSASQSCLEDTLKASTFGERLSYARWWRMGMIRRETDAEFAAALGVTDGAVSQWRDRTDPLDAEKCGAIAKLCDVPFDWLIRGDGASVPAPDLFARYLPVHREWTTRSKKEPQYKTRLGSATLRPRVVAEPSDKKKGRAR